MKINRKFLFSLATLTPIIPIATLVSCGATTSQSSEEATRQWLLERYPYNPREVKIVVPDELFPGVKQDPVKYDQIKENLLKYKERYDQDGNYLLENDEIIFKFDKDTFKKDLIANTDFAKKIFVDSVSEMNFIYKISRFNSSSDISKKSEIEFTTQNFHADGVSAGYFSAKIKVDDQTITHIDETVAHEFVHMQEYTIDNKFFINNDLGRDWWKNKFSTIAKKLNIEELNNWLRNIKTDDNYEIINSLKQVNANNYASTIMRDSKNIEPRDFLFTFMNKEEYEEKILTLQQYLFWDYDNTDNLFMLSVTGDMGYIWQIISMEFFAYLNTIFTYKINIEQINSTTSILFNSLPNSFGTNFFDITKPTQAYEIMKPFIEESYRVSKKPLVKWTGSALDILGAGFNQLNELDHFKVFHNGNEIYKNTFVKKDVAIGFNRNPFTPNEYKYVTQSIDNYFDLGAPLANSLQLNKTNTELKFYDASDKEINLDFEDALQYLN